MTVATEELICEVCGKGPFKNNAGVAAHTRIKHAEEKTDPFEDLPAEKTSQSGDIQALKSQLKDALQRAEKAEQERDEFKPTRDASTFILRNKDDVVARFGKQKLEDLARRELGVVNRRRASQNLPPIDLGPEDMKAKLEEVIQELLGDRERHGAATEGPIPKSIKMMTPSGHLVQIPYEAQINNLAGSLEDAIARYRNKGYKLAVDDENRTLCPAQNCYNSAAQDNGNNVFGGYCSRDHEQRTEMNKGKPIDPAVYTRR